MKKNQMNKVKRPYVRKVKAELVVEPIVEEPVATKRAYTKKVKKPTELEAAYTVLQRNHKDYYDLHLRFDKIITLLAISTILNVVLLGTVAVVMWGLK